MTTIVGITGGIGSGKSTFSKVVIKRGYKLMDSDQLVSLMYKKPTKEFLGFLKKINLGHAINGKKIDKKKISNEIFSNVKTKLRLEKHIFKTIRQKRADFIKKEKAKKTKIIFLDIPLLFENNLNKNFDVVISIISSKKERYKRLKKSKNISRLLFNKIIKSQTSDLVRKNKSDIIILNNTKMKNYIIKINKTLDSLEK